MVKLSITTRVNSVVWHWLDESAKKLEKSKAEIIEELVEGCRTGRPFLPFKKPKEEDSFLVGGKHE